VTTGTRFAKITRRADTGKGNKRLDWPLRPDLVGYAVRMGNLGPSRELRPSELCRLIVSGVEPPRAYSG